RRTHRALRPTTFYTGRPLGPGQPADLAWFDVDGAPFDHERWHDPAVRTLQMTRSTPDGDAVLVVMNGSLDAAEVVLANGHHRTWRLDWDSVWERPADAAPAPERIAAPGDTVRLEPLSLRVYVLA